MPRFTIEARYECGQLERRETYEAVSLIDALGKATHCTAFLFGDVRSNTIRSDLLVSCDGGPLVLVGAALAAEQMGMAA
jgi:hypothetical protein